MNNKEPFENLAQFYDALDSIPTPPLAVKPRRTWSLWSIAIAPFGAAVFAYGFVSLCAVGPTDSNATVPFRLSIDRYALDEIKSVPPTHRTNSHVSDEAFSEVLA